ncbi:hypothetical protein TraAM80_00219 [Trypanosoma rangeli]|uniref:Uncharacterized protein n=1 Tax=Trypanosoma rangeli TaxID=5698 RepID=A0A422P4T8_TRYRA|nr:uncharacterized protein TraAM80_00219 [Trypanosoma rangeli]RNF12674.1 hypothetical protein TraAM80_00219 [Trypanosoma rangeli]|eukprot:RNF12674.1 hypothetical protein TraAM80_00219 [Trypanosoma rangeli]
MEGRPLVTFRQRSFTHGEGATASCVHVSQQCFSDHVWVLITEDDTCVPGVVLRHDSHEMGLSASWENPNALPSTPCECLLGMRDHPLTNIVAGVIAHAIRAEGEQRPLLLCISLTKTAKRLENAVERKAFLRKVRDDVLALATGES